MTNLGGGGISRACFDEGLAERLSEEYLEAIYACPEICLTATGVCYPITTCKKKCLPP
ncbi:MAG: hypothetical protein ACLRSW_10710 [Christensenellaceae bacterium]